MDGNGISNKQTNKWKWKKMEISIKMQLKSNETHREEDISNE